MAQVFAAAVSVATGANGHAQDATSVPLGSLSSGAITSPTGLAGTNGIDAILLHGDQWREIKGNVTVDILKNLTTNITLSEKRTVLQNLKNRVVGTTNDTRIGVHQQYNVAPRFDNFAHHLTQTHSQPAIVHQPTTVWEIINKIFTMKSKSFNVTGVEFNTKGTKTETVGVETIFKVICIEMKQFIAKSGNQKIGYLNLAVNLRGVITEIKAVKLKAAASHLKAIGVNLCEGIAANFDSPMA